MTIDLPEYLEPLNWFIVFLEFALLIVIFLVIYSLTLMVRNAKKIGKKDNQRHHILFPVIFDIFKIAVAVMVFASVASTYIDTNIFPFQEFNEGAFLVLIISLLTMVVEALVPDVKTGA